MSLPLPRKTTLPKETAGRTCWPSTSATSASMFSSGFMSSVRRRPDLYLILYLLSSAWHTHVWLAWCKWTDALVSLVRGGCSCDTEGPYIKRGRMSLLVPTVLTVPLSVVSQRATGRARTLSVDNGYCAEYTRCMRGAKVLNMPLCRRHYCCCSHALW